jgi:hypothetical protein
MQPDPQSLARAAYEAAQRLPEPLSAAVIHWDEVHDDERAAWAGVAAAIQAAAQGTGRAAADAAMHAGIVEVGAEKYMRDAKGNLMALGTVKPQRLLEDEMVRKVMFFARDLSDQVRRFKGHTFADLAAFQSLLEQEYKVPPSTGKGNCSYTSFDDTMKVEVKIADQIAFGPELQAAKRLVDECLKEWGADSHEALRSLVNRVFSVEKEGQINRGELFSMLAMEIADERWQRAMDAIRDSIRVIGTKAYLRFRIREEDGAWSTVTIDLAAA